MSNVISFSKSTEDNDSLKKLGKEDESHHVATSDKVDLLHEINLRCFGGLGGLIMSAIYVAAKSLKVEYLFSATISDVHMPYLHCKKDPEWLFTPFTDEDRISGEESKYSGLCAQTLGLLLSSFVNERDGVLQTAHNVEVLCRALILSDYMFNHLLGPEFIKESIAKVVEGRKGNLIAPIDADQLNKLHENVKNSAIEPMILILKDSLPAIFEENAGSRAGKFFYHSVGEGTNMTHHLTVVFSDFTAYQFSISEIVGDELLVKTVEKRHDQYYLGPISLPPVSHQEPV